VVVVVAAPPPPPPSTLWSVGASALVGGPVHGRRSPLDWGADFGLGATRGRLMAEARARMWFPTDDAVAGMSTRMKFSGEGVALSLCALPFHSPKFGPIAFCAVGGAAALHGTSSGGLTSTSRTAPWYSAGLAVDEQVRLLRRLHLDLHIELDASLTRPEFALQSTDVPPVTTVVFTVQRVVPVVGLGLSFDL
jgi:hypothetical protein